MTDRKQMKALRDAAAALKVLEESDLPDHARSAFAPSRWLIVDYHLPTEQGPTRRRRPRRSHLKLVTD